MKARYLTIGVEDTVVSYTTEPTPVVALMLNLPDDQTGFPNDLGLAIQMTPAEARETAQALIRKADEAESAGSRHH